MGPTSPWGINKNIHSTWNSKSVAREPSFCHIPIVDPFRDAFARHVEATGKSIDRHPGAALGTKMAVAPNRNASLAFWVIFDKAMYPILGVGWCNAADVRNNHVVRRSYVALDPHNLVLAPGYPPDNAVGETRGGQQHCGLDQDVARGVLPAQRLNLSAWTAGRNYAEVV